MSTQSREPADATSEAADDDHAAHQLPSASLHRYRRDAEPGEKPATGSPRHRPPCSPADEESGPAAALAPLIAPPDENLFSCIRRHRRTLVHILVFCLATGWWVASLVLHRHDRNWVIPFLLWLGVVLRLMLWHVSLGSGPGAAARAAWRATAVRVADSVPPRLRAAAAGLLVAAAMVAISLLIPESGDNTRENRAVSLFGLGVLVLALWLTSRDRGRVNWRPVIVGMLLQFLIALFVLRTAVGYAIFKFVSDRARDLLGYSRDGVAFLTSAQVAGLPYFLLAVVPAIIFFISLVQVLHHVGFLQWFVYKIAVVVFWALAVSGAEAVVAAATPFVGQGESAMLVRPFLGSMTRAELHQVLTCGFATISGSVLVAYVGLGLNAEVLVSSCVMSIPASLAISKLRYPETEPTETAGRVIMPGEEAAVLPGEQWRSGRRNRAAGGRGASGEGTGRYENALHAFADGAWFGIRVGATIVSGLLCVLAAVGLVNGLLGWWGQYLNISNPDLSLQLVLGYGLYPVAFLLGVPRRSGDLTKVARLIAEKIVTNEYNAFHALTTDPWYTEGLSARSRLIATYACAGFGNLGSLGVQIGIISQLAPSRAGDVSRLAMSALVSGVLATLSSAAVAGLVVTDEGGGR